jgi:hypothetical protein
VRARDPQQPGSKRPDQDRDLCAVLERYRSRLDPELLAREAHLLAAQQPFEDLDVLVGVLSRRVVGQAKPVLDDDPV